MTSSNFQSVHPSRKLKFRVKNSNSSKKTRTSSGSPVSIVGVVRRSWYWLIITHAAALDPADAVLAAITTAVLVDAVIDTVVPSAFGVESDIGFA